MKNLSNFYNEFCVYLDKEDKQLCVFLIMNAVESGNIQIVELYEKILAPALNDMMERYGEEIFIWNEHVRSSIIRTIIECCYPHVLKRMEKSGTSLSKGKVLLVCPPEEYHELGARMGSDFFNLCGYSTVFTGANTPLEVIISGIVLEKPDYIVISASNYYNLVAAKRVIDAVRSVNSDIKILACGYAFHKDQALSRSIGAMAVVNSIGDILALEGD
ncbi:MAG: B12-binding domain-containing protein [Solirubrobacterales bacterium]